MIYGSAFELVSLSRQFIGSTSMHLIGKRSSTSLMHNRLDTVLQHLLSEGKSSMLTASSYTASSSISSRTSLFLGAGLSIIIRTLAAGIR